MYTVKQLSQLSGVSVRTLHWYDEIGLLYAKRCESNQYRVYDDELVDRLQQILFYRQLGLELAEIKTLLNNNESRQNALLNYRARLCNRLEEMQNLLHTLDKTIMHEKGEYVMQNKEKFDAFKQKLVRENEAIYGHEVREKYGDEVIDASNKLLLNMGHEKYDEMQSIGEEITLLLKKALADNALPQSDICKNIARKHKAWLCFTWAHYTANAHKGLALMYVSDERFTDYYDNACGKGAAQMLCDAITANV